jgi:tRNA/rRNA methyltransferase
VVLVRPETPANVGAAARAARNAGLHELALVGPGDWRTVECWRTAWGAHDLLEQAQVFPDLPSAVAGAHYVAGLSAKKERGAPTLDVREMAAEVASLAAGDCAALVFGPETTGLTREELVSCGRRASIPAHPGQPSLNLSHAVMVAGYEVFRAQLRPAPVPRRATHDEKDQLLELLRRGLTAIEALPVANTDGYFQEWKALFQRADLTPKEVRLLSHMARKMIGTATATATATTTTPQRHREHRERKEEDESNGGRNGESNGRSNE